MKPIVVVLAILFWSNSPSRQVYTIPFASKGNTIELTVANTSSLPTSQVSVEASSKPSWVKFSQASVQLDEIKANQEGTATFSFWVDKMAPIDAEQKLTFTVSAQSRGTWTKEIKIKVSPPERFELFQNFPNPFNPSTIIGYQLSTDSKVSLRVYDILGREVATLVDGNQAAGYHQEWFKGTGLASGMYVYRLAYTDQSGKQASDKKVMLLVK